MASMRGWLRVGVVLALVTIAGVASSKSGGITGHSGKQGPICSSCHNGGKTPTVKIEGPTSLDAGVLAVYTFRVQTDAAITGMNAAVSDGLLGEVDGGRTALDTFENELTHPGNAVKPDAATGEAVYTFSMTAPQFGGTVSLYAAGNACNNNNAEDGDQAASAKLDIVVNGPPKPPPVEAGPPPVKPPPVNPPADSGSPTGDSGSGGFDAGDDAPPPAEESGCNVGWSDRSSAPAGAMLAALVGLAMVGRKRRRGRRHL
jgi:hypothetical protein